MHNEVGTCVEICVSLPNPKMDFESKLSTVCVNSLHQIQIQIIWLSHYCLIHSLGNGSGNRSQKTGED